MTSLHALARDTRGATVIEFALCASAFMALLLAATQTAIMFFAQQGIQTSAERIARQVMTGEVRQTTLSQEKFRQAACATLPSYMNCTKLYVDVRAASTFDTLDTAGPTITRGASGTLTNSWSYSTGGSGAIVILRLYYDWGVVNGPLGFTIGNQTDKSRLLIGTMVFKAEQYTA